MSSLLPAPVPYPATENDRRVDSHVIAVAAALNAQLGEIATAMRSLLADAIGELGDERLLDLLGASIQGNVDTILHILQHDIPLQHVEPPSAAFEYARRLAQHGVPVNALVRAYRLGQDHLLKWIFEEIGRHVEDARIAFLASQRIVSVTFSYIDWMSEEVVTVYEKERERWRENPHTIRAARIRDLLNNHDRDLDAAEAAIGYPLRQYHLGVVVWLPDAATWSGAHGHLEQEEAHFERFLRALGHELSSTGRPLFAPFDRFSAWGWLPLGRSPRRPGTAAVEKILRSATPDLMIALGGPACGPDGFRDTHRQALHAQRLAVVAGPCAGRVTAYNDRWVRAAAMMGSDLEQTRMLVRTALGPLAADDDYHARLRSTLLTFLSTSSNYTTTAQLLSMHKNSVKYRVAKAEEERGAAIENDRLDVELALVACRWLGPAVLIPATRT